MGFNSSLCSITVITTNFVAYGKGELHHLCLVSYRFPESKQAFHPTWPSVIVKMKSQSHHFGPKKLEILLVQQLKANCHEMSTKYPTCVTVKGTNQ